LVCFFHPPRISMVQVAYSNLNQGQRDLIAGHVDVILDPAVARAIELHLAGKLKILGVAGGARDPRLPDVPAISETLPGYEFVEWFAVMAPPNTPAAIADKVSRDIAETLRIPAVIERLDPMGYNAPVGGTPAETAALISKGSDYWREIIESIGMTKSK
jgi:tripartite-type tricarboxylate transporter receptor subunit TctC